jgi:hypothetical protein
VALAGTTLAPTWLRRAMSRVAGQPLARLEVIMGLILLIVLLLLLLGGLPRWPHSRDWGYGPSGILGVILVVILVLVLVGYVPMRF